MNSYPEGHGTNPCRHYVSGKGTPAPKRPVDRAKSNTDKEGISGVKKITHQNKRGFKGGNVFPPPLKMKEKRRNENA